MIQSPLRRSLFPTCAVALLTAAAAPSQAALLSYYVGIDDLPTIASGAYAGLPNPNHNSLTFLYAHTYEDTPASNHYHSKAVQVYTGPNLGAGNTAVTTSTGDYVPEGLTPPVRLSAGTGVFDGKLVSLPYTDPSDPGYHASFLEMGSTQSLSGSAAGSGESILFTSSGGRWDSSFDAAHIHLELVSLTPGLNVGGLNSLSLGMTAPGDDIHLADGDEFFSFTPVLWTEADAAPGVYEAAFVLRDLSGAYGDSGVFRVRTEIVPEPSGIALTIFGTLMCGGLNRRRKSGYSKAG